MEPSSRDGRQRWPESLVQAIERAAEAGWPQTARMIAMLVVAATALLLVVLASRS